MMLMNRSRAINSKQGLMPDQFTLNSPTRKFLSRPTASSLIPSPSFSVGFSEKEASAMSPTSILESKPFSVTVHHFISDTNQRPLLNNMSETRHHPRSVVADSKTIGLGLLDGLSVEKNDMKSSNSESRMVLFGSQLKIQLPSNIQKGLMESPHPVIEFGVKNKYSQLAMALLSPSRIPADEQPSPVSSLSVSEMEQSEDYTRVISHGTNPRTTHIFDACIMETCGNGSNSLRKEIRFSTEGEGGCFSDDFLAFCHACRKKLEQEKEIFMHRQCCLFLNNEMTPFFYS